jgi:ankyrin repeat protein
MRMRAFAALVASAAILTPLSPAWGGDDDSNLHYYAQEGDKAGVAKELRSGVDVNVKDEHGATALMYAATKGRDEILQLLLDKGADPNIPDRQADTPLIQAALAGHENAVRILIAGGADVAVTDQIRFTALHAAAQKGNVVMIGLLLDKGASLKAKDRDAATPLHIAAQEGQLAAVQLLLDKGADLNARDSQGRSPIFRGCSKAHADVVKLLLDRKALLTSTNVIFGNALHSAARGGSAEIAAMLIAHGVPLEGQEFGKTPLGIAVEQKQVAVVKLLVEKGANVNANADGESLLASAQKAGSAEIVEILKAHGAK